MMLENPTEFESTDLELPSDATKLGVDGNGATHYYSRHHHEVFVAEPDDTPRTFNLESTPCDVLSEWVGHVEAQRGEWRDLLYHDAEPFAHLADQIEELVTDV